MIRMPMGLHQDRMREISCGCKSRSVMRMTGGGTEDAYEKCLVKTLSDLLFRSQISDLRFETFLSEMRLPEH